MRRKHASALGASVALGLLAALAPVPAPAAEPGWKAGIAMHGEPAYRPGFDAFGYVEPDAPKGGTVTLSAVGGFDTLNPFTIRGVPAAGVGYVHDTLMAPSLDEPFSQYPLLARRVRTPADRSWVEFELDPRARFHDGRPVTAEDVLFTFEALIRANPFYRAYYAGVSRASSPRPGVVRFDFAPGDNRELPLILGQLPVLPAHWWRGRDFEETMLEPPLGSGPYRVAEVVPGRAVAYERAPGYWGRDLPANRGRFNFDRIEYDHYRDAGVALEAFRAGLVDFRVEGSAKDWATGYDTAEARDGRIVLEEVPSRAPAGMQAFVFNTRRPVFEDPRVRLAVSQAFDFAWANAVLFHGAYERTDSYFENSDLAAEGLPGPEELAILEPLRGRIPEEVFARDYAPPDAGTPEDLRENLLRAQDLLEAAGWVVRDGRRVHAETGRPLSFEILLDDPAFERVALPLVANLRRLGIEARVRTVDTAQYQNLVRGFDFDMTVAVWPQSASPGNEQRDYWTSRAADVPGSRNLAGIRDPAVDALVERLVAAKTRGELETAAKALDRVLLWGHYAIPHWHAEAVRVAYWRRLAHPEPLPPYGIAFDAWWVRADAQADASARAPGAAD